MITEITVKPINREIFEKTDFRDEDELTIRNLRDFKYKLLEHSHHLPDLALSDFHLFTSETLEELH